MSKQGGVSSPARTATPRQAHGTRTPAEKKALAALVSPARLGSGPVVGFLVEPPRLPPHQPGERPIHESPSPFTQEEGRKQFQNHFNSSQEVNCYTLIKAWFIKQNPKLE